MKVDKKKAVLVDIDGTLVSVTPNWSMERNAEWEMDTVNASVLADGVELLKKFKEEGYVLVFLTARGQGCKKYTVKKMKEIGVWDMVDSMWHRPLKWEGKKSSLYKEAMIKMLAKKYDFEWAMDDEDPNLEMMERMGMKVIDAKQWW
jgi:predicted secreted acid phosphatase